MKLDEAIEILTIREKNTSPALRDNFKDALKLGIEALKGIKEYRKWPMSISLKQLPGETEE